MHESIAAKTKFTCNKPDTGNSRIIILSIFTDSDGCHDMSEQELRQKLEHLKTEVNSLASDDHASRERLEKLIDDIETRLEQDEASVSDENLLDHVQESITHFETKHPRATAILNDIMVTLSNMGI